MEIQKYDLPTYGLTWVGARDTCVSKKNPQEWHDDKLRWEPSEYGGVEEIYVPR